MKVFLVLLFLFILNSAQANLAQMNNSELLKYRMNHNKNGQLIIIQVKGMVCEFCSATIKKNFSKINNISDIEVSLNNKKIYLMATKDFKLTDQEIVKVIENNGYNVSNIERI